MESIIKAKKQAQILSKRKGIKIKDALDLIAVENNFSSWKEYKDSLDTFWCGDASPFLNHWFSSHSEAEKFKNANSGFLLTYKGQYFVASSEYIEFLGLDPKAEVWSIIDYDVSSSNSFDKLYEYLKKSRATEGLK